MAIYLPASAEEQELSLDELTPREIVAELDKHVVGQRAAKRAVAIALRNRQRRQKLPPDMADDIMPKNIIMIGPTGVGKTEIARRLAKLTNSPFLKVEASKFTEVGYVGRDVESMIRDLVEIGIDMVREERLEEVEDRAEMNAEERLLDVLCLRRPRRRTGRRANSSCLSPRVTNDRAKSCASNFARASSTTVSWRLMPANATRRSSASSVTRTLKTWR